MRGHEADAEPAATAFGNHAKDETDPPHAPPSLALGLGELRRVL